MEKKDKNKLKEQKENKMKDEWEKINDCYKNNINYNYLQENKKNNDKISNQHILCEYKKIIFINKNINNENEKCIECHCNNYNKDNSYYEINLNNKKNEYLNDSNLINNKLFLNKDNYNKINENDFKEEKNENEPKKKYIFLKNVLKFEKILIKKNEQIQLLKDYISKNFVEL